MWGFWPVISGYTPAIAFGRLAAMNWRRGLLLAGINLAVALPMIVMMEARDQKYALTQEEIMARAASKDAPRPPESPAPEPDQSSPEQAEETVSVTFDPCAMWGHYPVQVVVVQGADMPSVALAGWEDDCPRIGRLRGDYAEKRPGRQRPCGWRCSARSMPACA
jgi:hypothetical protein